MRRLLLVVLIAFSASALAQAQKRPPKLEPLPEPPPPPPMSPIEGPAVRIPVQEGDKIEEIRQGGRVVMLELARPDGRTYDLVDTAVSGSWLRRDSLDDGARVPMWPIHTWD